MRQRSYRDEEGSEKCALTPPNITLSTDSLQARKNGECTITLARVEADITRLLGMEAPTELCYHKCRLIQARFSHNQAGEKKTSGDCGGRGATTFIG